MTIKLPKEQKDYIITLIQQYFLTERDEEIGNLAAENLLYFFMSEIGPFYYNKGIADAKEMVNQKVVSIEEDLASLERPMMRRR